MLTPNMLLLALLISCFTIIRTETRFQTIREWKFINFTWPNAETYKTAIEKGIYVPENNLIGGVKYYEEYYYLTLPRMKNGVPATLARIPAGKTKDPAPLLEPFPSWDLNTREDCNALQNVQNIEIDTEGQFWIIDGGRRDTLTPIPIVKCPPKLIIYDIKRNLTTTTYVFPDNVASVKESFLYDIVLDTTDGGYAYITDNSGRDPGIVVFSFEKMDSWKIRHSPSMEADPLAVQFHVDQITITSPINIAGIALGPKIRKNNDHVVINEDREVYFSPLSSLHLYSVNTSVLKREENAKPETNLNIKDLGLKASQSNGMLMDNKGVLYYTLLGSNSIAKWDSHKSFQLGQKIIAQDKNFLTWPNSLTFTANGNLTVLSNKLNVFIYGNLNLNEPNFRLITASVGGNSYLHDEAYNYNSVSTGDSTITTSSSVPSEPEYHVYGSTVGPASQLDSTSTQIHHSNVNGTNSVTIKKNAGAASRWSLNIIIIGLCCVLYTHHCIKL